ncbi:hypothetical protein ACJX0J_006887, partial [Zea mays]
YIGEFAQHALLEGGQSWTDDLTVTCRKNLYLSYANLLIWLYIPFSIDSVNNIHTTLIGFDDYITIKNGSFLNDAKADWKQSSNNNTHVTFRLEYDYIKKLVLDDFGLDQKDMLERHVSLKNQVVLRRDSDKGISQRMRIPQ